MKWGILEAFGIFAISVSGHTSLPVLRNSMRNPKARPPAARRSAGRACAEQLWRRAPLRSAPAGLDTLRGIAYCFQPLLHVVQRRTPYHEVERSEACQQACSSCA